MEDGYIKNPDSEKPVQVMKGSYSYIGPDEKVLKFLLPHCHSVHNITKLLYITKSNMVIVFEAVSNLSLQK